MALMWPWWSFCLVHIVQNANSMRIVATSASFTAEPLGLLMYCTSGLMLTAGVSCTL